MRYNPKLWQNRKETWDTLNFFVQKIQETGKPFGLRFDPAMFSDEALRIMLAAQVNYVLSGYGSIRMVLSTSEGETTRTKIDQLGILEQIGAGKNPIAELFSEVAKPNVVKGIIIQEKSSARKFIEEEVSSIDVI